MDRDEIKRILMDIYEKLPYPLMKWHKYINNINTSFFNKNVVKRWYVIKKDIEQFLSKTNKYLEELNKIDTNIKMLSNEDVENVFIKEMSKIIRLWILMLQKAVYAEANKWGYILGEVKDKDKLEEKTEKEIMKDIMKDINNTVLLYSKYVYWDNISNKAYKLYLKILLYIYYKWQEKWYFTEKEANNLYKLLTKNFRNVYKYTYDDIISFFDKKKNKKYVEKLFDNIDNKRNDTINAYWLKEIFEFVVKEIYEIDDIEVNIDSYINWINITWTVISIPESWTYSFIRAFKLIAHEIEGHYLRFINHNNDIIGDVINIEEWYAIFNEKMLFVDKIKELDRTVSLSYLAVFIAENADKKDTYKIIKYLNKTPYLNRYLTKERIKQAVKRKKRNNFFQVPWWNQRDRMYYEGYLRMIKLVKNDYENYFRLSEGKINTQHIPLYKKPKNVVYNMWIWKILYKIYTENFTKDQTINFINNFILIKEKKKVINKLDKIYELFNLIQNIKTWN